MLPIPQSSETKMHKRSRGVASSPVDLTKQEPIMPRQSSGRSLALGTVSVAVAGVNDEIRSEPEAVNVSVATTRALPATGRKARAVARSERKKDQTQSVATETATGNGATRSYRDAVIGVSVERVGVATEEAKRVPTRGAERSIAASEIIANQTSLASATTTAETVAGTMETTVIGFTDPQPTGQPGVPVTIYVPSGINTRSMILTGREKRAAEREGRAPRTAPPAPSVATQVDDDNGSPSGESDVSNYSESPAAKRQRSGTRKPKRPSTSGRTEPVPAEVPLADADQVDLPIAESGHSDSADFETPPRSSRKRKPCERTEPQEFTQSDNPGVDEEEPNHSKTTAASTGRKNNGQTPSQQRSKRKKRAVGVEKSADESSGTTVDSDMSIPLEILGFGPPKTTRGEFAHGLGTDFESWNGFETALRQFELSTFQLFKIRTSKSVKGRNKKVVGEGYVIPTEWETYSRTMKCTHSFKPQIKDGEKERQRRSVKFTNCKASINATVQPFTIATEEKPVTGGFCIRWTASGGHNHALSPQLFRYYADNRLIKDPATIFEVGQWMRTGSTAQGILHELRRETGKPLLIRDIHNLMARVKRDEIAGTTVEERLASTLQFFVATAGSWANVHTNDDTDGAESVVFQSATMRRLFAAFPEVVLVDCTHSTNRSKFILFSFVVHDVFGKGQYVNHALMHRETMDNMEDAAVAFKTRNPRWSEIRAFLVDKDFKERTILHAHFPAARILLCHYHVIKYLAKKIQKLVRGTKDEKDAIVDVLRALVYSKSRAVYDALKILLAKRLGPLSTQADVDLGAEDEEDVFSDDEDAEHDDGEIDFDSIDRLSEAAVREAREDENVARGRRHVFFQYFLKNWESCVAEWVLYERQNVAHLGNNTNNRIEAKWGQMKRVVRANMDLEQTVRTVLAMQGVSEDEYMKELTNIGPKLVYNDDAELNQLMNVVSDHAYKLVEGEYMAVKKNDVHYTVRDEDAIAVLKSTTVAAGEEHTEHTISLENFSCSCFFAQVRLLPCRHVFFYRTYKNFESPRSFEAIIPFKFIHKRWSVRNPANNIGVGDVAPGGYTVKHARATPIDKMSRGDRFCKAMSVLKPVASAMAEMKGTAFVSLLAAMVSIKKLVERGIVPRLQNGDPPGTDQETPCSAPPPPPPQPAEASAHSQDEDEVDGYVNDVLQSPQSFKIPPVVNTQRARRQARMTTSASAMSAIQDEVARIRFTQSGPKTTLTLADIQAVLEMTTYSYDDAITVIADIPILRTATESTVVLQLPEHVVAATTSIRFVLQEAVVAQLRDSLHDQHASRREKDCIIRVGDGKGFVSARQLTIMSAFYVAMQRVHDVITACQWLERVEVAEVVAFEPFNMIGSLDQTFIPGVIATVKAMSLCDTNTATGMTVPIHLLRFCSSQWLNTTCIVATMECFQGRYNNVGIVSPDYANMKDADSRKKVLMRFKAMDTSSKSIIAVVNPTGSHWIAFFVDCEDDVCVLFDPLQNKSTVARLKKRVQTDVETILARKFSYRTYTDALQTDGVNCGVFCLVFLEIMLSRTEWQNTYTAYMPFFRARYMQMAATLVRGYSVD